MYIEKDKEKTNNIKIKIFQLLPFQLNHVRDKRQDNIYNRKQDIKVSKFFFIDISERQFKYIKWCLNGVYTHTHIHIYIYIYIYIYI